MNITWEQNLLSISVLQTLQRVCSFAVAFISQGFLLAIHHASAQSPSQKKTKRIFPFKHRGIFLGDLRIELPSPVKQPEIKSCSFFLTWPPLLSMSRRSFYFHCLLNSPLPLFCFLRELLLKVIIDFAIISLVWMNNRVTEMKLTLGRNRKRRPFVPSNCLLFIFER